MLRLSEEIIAVGFPNGWSQCHAWFDSNHLKYSDLLWGGWGWPVLLLLFLALLLLLSEYFCWYFHLCSYQDGSILIVNYLVLLLLLLALLLSEYCCWYVHWFCYCDGSFLILSSSLLVSLLFPFFIFIVIPWGGFRLRDVIVIAFIIAIGGFGLLKDSGKLLCHWHCYCDYICYCYCYCQNIDILIVFLFFRFREEGLVCAKRADEWEAGAPRFQDNSSVASRPLVHSHVRIVGRSDSLIVVYSYNWKLRYSNTQILGKGEKLFITGKSAYIQWRNTFNISFWDWLADIAMVWKGVKRVLLIILSGAK